jgi:heptosyltransferase-1
LKVLIVKVSALGDVVHALPVLAYLRSVDPTMMIDWVVEEPVANLLEHHPWLNRVYRIHTRRWRRPETLPDGGLQLGRTIRMLRREHYDAVLDLQGNSKSGLLTLLCGAAQRFGFDAGAVREWPNLLATNRRVAITTADQHVTDRYVRIAATAFPGGVPPLTAGPLFPSPAGLQQVRAFFERQDLSAERTVVFHYGTSWPTKLWALEHWQHLARRLVLELNRTVLLTWGNRDEWLACRSIQEAAVERTLIWPKHDLSTLVALLAGVAAVVGGDTGPIHLAAAVGTPTVSLYRVTDPARNGPRGPQHRRLRAPLPCSSCLHKRCPRDDQCSRSISVEAVFQALCELLRPS